MLISTQLSKLKHLHTKIVCHFKRAEAEDTDLAAEKRRRLVNDGKY